MKAPSSSYVFILLFMMKRIAGKYIYIFGSNGLSKVFHGIFLSSEGVPRCSLFMVAEHTPSYLFSHRVYTSLHLNKLEWMVVTLTHDHLHVLASELPGYVAFKLVL